MQRSYHTNFQYSIKITFTRLNDRARIQFSENIIIYITNFLFYHAIKLLLRWIINNLLLNIRYLCIIARIFLLSIKDKNRSKKKNYINGAITHRVFTFPVDVSSADHDGRRQHERRRVRGGRRCLHGGFQRFNTEVYGPTFDHDPFADRISRLQASSGSIRR